MNIDKLLANLPASTAEQRRQMRVNAGRLLSSGTPAQQAAAQRMLGALDQQESGERETLASELAVMDIADRVVRAFTVQPMTAAEDKLVRVLLDHPGSTSKELSRAMNWKAMSWHMHFGTMCEKREAYLWPAKDAVVREGKFYSGILADLTPDNRFTMKPEVAAAFARLGIHPRRQPAASTGSAGHP